MKNTSPLPRPQAGGIKINVTLTNRRILDEVAEKRNLNWNWNRRRMRNTQMDINFIDIMNKIAECRKHNGSRVERKLCAVNCSDTKNNAHRYRKRERKRDLARSADSLYAHVWAIIWCGCISARGPCVCMLYAWHMFKYLYYHSCSLGATMWMAVSGLCCEQEVTAGSTPRSMYCGLTASHCGAAVVIRREWTRMDSNGGLKCAI